MKSANNLDALFADAETLPGQSWSLNQPVLEPVDIQILLRRNRHD